MDKAVLNFASDNVRGCAPAVLQALVDGLDGPAPAYGEDAVSRRLEARFAELFEAPVAVGPVVTGSAANAIGLSMIVPPHGAVLCHAEAHINRAEAGGPELFTGGAKLVGVAGAHNKLSRAALAEALAEQRAAGYHASQVSALSLTQLNEQGRAYSVEEVGRLADWAKGKGLAVHMDGARFANAVAGQGASPAEMTWRAGVDVLSFGASKNGCLAAEAIILFHPSEAQRQALEHKRKRAGQVASKHRFLALQLEAYINDGLWLDMARHANAQARRLAEGLGQVPGIELVEAVDGNEVFFTLPAEIEAAMAADGVVMASWDAHVRRMVAAFDTDPGDVDKVIASARASAGMAEARPARAASADASD